MEQNKLKLEDCCLTIEQAKEYYVKFLKDGSIGIYSDKMTKHKIGIGTKIK